MTPPNALFKRTGAADFPDHLKVLITGDPKSGKTTFLGTVPNMVILDTEPHANNLQSVAHLNMPHATIQSSTDLQQAHLMLADQSMRNLMAQGLGMDKIEAVAIDTLDTLQAIFKRERMRAQRQTQFLRDDWGWLKEEMTSVVSSFTALPLHVFFVVHTKTKDVGNAEKGDGRTVILPGLEGAIAESIAGMVGYSLLAFRRSDVDLATGKAKTTYYLRAEGDETYGFLGNRAAGRLPDIIDPNFATLSAAADSGRKRAQEAHRETGTVTPPPQIQQATAIQPPPGQATVQPPVQTQASTVQNTVVQNAPAQNNLVQKSDQAQAPQAPLPADDEPINPAAISHVKRVYDAIGIAFPEELVSGKTVGEARTVVKMWRAIQEDNAAGKLESKNPQAEMAEFLDTLGWLPSGPQPRAQAPTVEPKIDGTIEQVKAYVGDDLARAQEAFDLEYAKDKPRGGVIDFLIKKGVTVPPRLPAEPVQTSVENATAGQEPGAVTPDSATADAPPTEAEAVETVKEALGGEVVKEQGEGNCEKCGNPIDDPDIAKLAVARFGKRLCVNDYVRGSQPA